MESLDLAWCTRALPPSRPRPRSQSVCVPTNESTLALKPTFPRRRWSAPAIASSTDDGLGIGDSHDDTNTNKETKPGITRAKIDAWAYNVLAEVSATSWGKKVAEQFSLQPSSYQKMSSTEGEVGASPDALLSRLRVLEMLDSATEDAQRPPQLKIRHETEDSPTGASWEGSSHSLEVLAA